MAQFIDFPAAAGLLGIPANCVRNLTEEHKRTIRIGRDLRAVETVREAMDRLRTGS